jgi:hypothetical protein
MARTEDEMEQAQAKLGGAVVQQILNAIAEGLADYELQRRLARTLRRVVATQSYALLSRRLVAEETPERDTRLSFPEASTMEQALREFEVTLAEVHGVLLDRVRSRLRAFIRQEMYGVYYDLLEDVEHAPLDQSALATEEAGVGVLPSVKPSPRALRERQSALYEESPPMVGLRRMVGASWFQTAAQRGIAPTASQATAGDEALIALPRTDAAQTAPLVENPAGQAGWRTRSEPQAS